MNTTFNLSTYLTKKANMAYEGSQGYFQAQQRAWQRCVACKQKEGKSAQESWQGCFDEFQKGDRKLSWIQNYAGDVVESVNKGINTSASLDYSNEISKFASEGMAIGAAVTKAIEAKIAQVESQPEQSSDGVETKDFVLRTFDRELGSWAYYGESSSTENVSPSNLSSAKRFTREEAFAMANQLKGKFGKQFSPASANEGDLSKI